MLRRLRFGTLSLFATMLLVVSAAGWWKFNRDLYLEEQGLLDALAKEGCSVHVSRRLPGENDPSAPARPLEPKVWTEHLYRVRVLACSGNASSELRARMAALSGLELLQISEPVDPKASLPPLPPFEETLGRAMPEWGDPALDRASVDEPHPKGTALNEAETAKLIEDVRRAWSSRTTPDRFVRIVEEDTFGWGAVRVLHARDGAAQMVSEDQTPPALHRGRLQITDGGQSCILEPTGTGWRIMNWVSPNVHKRMHLTPISIDRYIYPVFAQRTSDLDHVASAERLDGDKVRLAFEPHVRNLFAGPGPTISIEERSLILDGELDWAPVSIREVSRHSVSPTRAPSDRVAHEYRFERIGEYVLPVEAVGSKFRTRVAWKIEPQFEPATFKIERYVDPPLPGAAELPFWRWYRVTFAVSFAIFALLIGRSAIGLLGRARTSETRAEVESPSGKAVDHASDETKTNASSSSRNLLTSDSSD